MFEKPLMNFEYFSLLTDQFRSPHLWYWDKDVRKWFLRHKVENNSSLSQEESAKSWEGNQRIL